MHQIDKKRHCFKARSKNANRYSLNELMKMVKLIRHKLLTSPPTSHANTKGQDKIHHQVNGTFNSREH